MTRRGSSWAGLVVTLVAFLGLTLAAATATPAAAGSEDARPLVVVGIPGLTWSDVRDGDLPHVTGLADRGSLGSLTVRAVRSTSCATDGWLTLSSGRRAADALAGCRDPGPVVGGTVPLWEEFVAAARGAGYGARPGTLGTAVAAAGGCVATVGPGAAIGGADASGRVAHHSEALPDRFDCVITLIDGEVLPTEGPARTTVLARADDLVGRVVAVADASGADVVVAGLGDGVSPVRPRAVVAAGPSFPAGLLSSASTRQPGVAQLQDLTATALARAGAGTEGVTGRVLTASADGSPVAERVADRVGFEERAATLRSVSPQVTGWLAAGFALWCLAVAVVWWRREAGTPLPRGLVVAGVAVASVPVATFVANLVPWWRSGAPAAAFVALLLGVVALVGGAALLAERRRHLGGLLVVAVVTLLVLGGDVLLGSRLQLGSVFGQNPTVGGRFYGFGNTSFALYGVAVLAVVAALAAPGRFGRWGGPALGLGVLVAALGLEALPSLGADFGGPPGLLLGGLLVLATATGLRLTVVRVVLAALGSVALVAGVAVLDWLRPAGSRTHLGAFVETVVTGGADEVVGRKVAQNLANLGSPPLLAMTVAALVLVTVAWRTGRGPSAPGGVVLRGAAVMALVGFAVNDSGLVIPAFVAAVLAPLLVAAGARSGADRVSGR
ncbi:hypothetical protein ACK8HX_00725 [Oryzobacter sp. R7]|uniref:hypothetical protein n=1 Tax=Oryzobacter faecalis TaxID=3388656 RepID=UPI00398D27F4